MTKAPDGSENAYSTFCKEDLVSKLSNLGSYKNSKKHKERHKKHKQRSLPKYCLCCSAVREVDDTQVENVEVQMAVSMACHCSIATVDHLSEIITKNSGNSVLKNMLLRRSKWSCLIKNVIELAI